MIGWIGTGVMGNPMCGHIMKKTGLRTLVFNRTKEKAASLVEAGAEYKSPKEIAAEADYLFLMLGYPIDVETTLLGEDGLLKLMKKGSYVVDHSTSSPGLAERIHATAKDLGIHSLDCPVSGGSFGAINGNLVVMCGGDEEAFGHAKGLMDTYGQDVRLMGGPGKGQHTKMVNQIMVGTNHIGVAEALIYCEKTGLDKKEVTELLQGGAAGSFALTK